MSSGVARPTDAVAAGDEAFMRLALVAARRAALAGEPPIGACLVRDGQVIATASNAVITELDITAHAEIMAIRDACRRGRTLELAGCTLYTTVEPCGMCRAASHYARIDEIVHAASLADMQALTGAELGSSGIGPLMRGDCLRDESLALLRAWAGRRSA